MIGLIAALIAVYLGAAGPRFRWAGAGLLAACAVLAGVIDTALDAHQATAQGLHYRITMTSGLDALLLQAIFMLGFFAMAAVSRWSARRLIAHDAAPASPSEAR